MTSCGELGSLGHTSYRFIASISSTISLSVVSCSGSLPSSALDSADQRRVKEWIDDRMDPGLGDRGGTSPLDVISSRMANNQPIPNNGIWACILAITSCSSSRTIMSFRKGPFHSIHCAPQNVALFMLRPPFFFWMKRLKNRAEIGYHESIVIVTSIVAAAFCYDLLATASFKQASI
jgi:hypothetical protein